MTDQARGVYLAMARLFLVVGGVVGALGLADLVFDLGIFRGSPVLTALLVLAIGAALHWTARTAPRRREEADEAEPEADGSRES